jgi:hypothetical protein
MVCCFHFGCVASLYAHSLGANQWPAKLKTCATWTSKSCHPAGLKYGLANKIRFLRNICGRRASTSSRCGCGDIYPEQFEEDGNSSVSFNMYVVEHCGYTLRLWSYHELGVDSLQALGNSTYRSQLRVEARLRMVQWVEEAIEAELKAPHMVDKEGSVRLYG